MNWCLLCLTFLFSSFPPSTVRLCSYICFSSTHIKFVPDIYFAGTTHTHRFCRLHKCDFSLFLCLCVFAAAAICLGSKQTNKQTTHNKIKRIMFAQYTFTKAICLHLTVVDCHMPWADSSFMYFCCCCRCMLRTMSLAQTHTCGLLLFLLLILLLFLLFTGIYTRQYSVFNVIINRLQK